MPLLVCCPTPPCNRSPSHPGSWGFVHTPVFWAQPTDSQWGWGLGTGWATPAGQCCYPQTMPCWLEEIILQDLLIQRGICGPPYADKMAWATGREEPPQHDAATTMLYCGDGIVRLECLPCLMPDHFGGIVTKQFKFGLIWPDDFPPVILRVVQVVTGELEVLWEVSFGFQGDLPGASSLETIASQCPGDDGQWDASSQLAQRALEVLSCCHWGNSCCLWQLDLGPAGEFPWVASPPGIGGLPCGPPPADDIVHSGARHIEGVGYLANGFAKPMLSDDGILDVGGQLFPRRHRVGSSPSNDSCMWPAVSCSASSAVSWSQCFVSVPIASYTGLQTSATCSVQWLLHRGRRPLKEGGGGWRPKGGRKNLKFHFKKAAKLAWFLSLRWVSDGFCTAL